MAAVKLTMTASTLTMSPRCSCPEGANSRLTTLFPVVFFVKLPHINRPSQGGGVLNHADFSDRVPSLSNRLHPVGPAFNFQVDVLINDFVARRTVSHNYEGGVFRDQVKEVMTVSGTRRKGDASARPDSLASRIGDEDKFAFEFVPELVLFCGGMPGRRAEQR